MLNIIADEKIPLLNECFGRWGTIVRRPGNMITAKDLTNADILLTRTITTVNESLLKNSKIRFVGSATAGVDHLDTDWLNKNSIKWTNAPGCNARAVVNYVLCCIAQLQTDKMLSNTFTAGIIGCGQVGARLAKQFKALGIKALENDPPRALLDSNFRSVALSAFKDLDLICLHTPLVHSGDHPTHHLVSSKFLQSLKPGAIVLNAGRGPVLDSKAMLQTDHLKFCLDVFENEPAIDQAVLTKAIIATPHIAGYSLAAKYRATLMIYQQACQFFNQPMDTINLPTTAQRIAIERTHWQRDALGIFDPATLTEKMRQDLLANDNVAAQFEQLRRHYTLRTEFNAIN